MRSKILILIVCSVVLLSGCSKTNDKIDSSSKVIFSEYFSTGEYEASIKVIDLPPELKERNNTINTKFSQSIAKHQEWLGEYIAQYSGEVLPWHENFGITKEEYDELLDMEDKMTLIEKKKTNLKFSDLGDGLILLEKNLELSYLSDIIFDINKNEIIIANQTLRYSNEITASEGQRITGPWNGNTWRINFEEVPSSMQIDKNKIYGYISLSIGKLTETDEVILYYTEKIIKDGYKQTGEEILIFKH